MNTTSKTSIQNAFLELLTINTKEEKYEMEKQRIHFMFFSKIEKIMSEQGISRKELASKVGTSPSYITQLFRGTKIANLDILSKINIEMDVSMDIGVEQKKPLISINSSSFPNYVHRREEFKVPTLGWSNVSQEGNLCTEVA